MTDRHDHDVMDIYGAAKEHHGHREYASADQLEQFSRQMAEYTIATAEILERATGRLAELERDRDAMIRRMRALEEALSLPAADELGGQAQTCPGGC